MFEFKRCLRYASANPENYHRDDNLLELWVTIPEYETEEAIIKDTRDFFTDSEVVRLLNGKNLVIIGDINPSVLICLGHVLPELCQTLSIYNPQTEKTVLVTQ